MAAEFQVRMRPSLSIGNDAGGNAVEHGFDVLAASFNVFVLAFELDRRALEPSAGWRPGHPPCD